MSNCCRVTNVMCHLTAEQINIEEFWEAVKPIKEDPGFLDGKHSDQEWEAWYDKFYPYWFLQQNDTVMRSGDDIWISFNGVRSSYCFRDLAGTVDWIGKFMKVKVEWPTTLIDEEAGGAARVTFTFDPFGSKDPLGLKGE